MLTAPQLINYYPKYEYLDTMLSNSSSKNVNIFVDLKGCMQTLYQEWAVRYVVEQSQTLKFVDCSIFFSVLNFISFHKKYAKKRNININLIFFFESGKSVYHTDIYKQYKYKRSTCDVLNLPEAYKELFAKISSKNNEVINKICNKLPGVSCIRMNFLEADFIPYYIMNYIQTESNDDTNIIYSMDKDMFQCLKKRNDFQFYRHHTCHKILDRDNAWKHYLFKGIKNEEKMIEIENNFKNKSLDYFPLILSICGDAIDCVPKGIKGVGEITFYKNYFNEIENIFGTTDEFYSNIINKNTIFKNEEIKNSTNENIRKLVENEKTIIQNLKLTSFKLLSECIDKPSTTDFMERKKYIQESIKNTVKINKGVVLIDALKNFGLGDYIEEQSIYDIF